MESRLAVKFAVSSIALGRDAYEPEGRPLTERTSAKARSPKKRTEATLEKADAAVARYSDLVFSLCENLLNDVSLAQQTVADVFAALNAHSDVYANSAVESDEFQREVHRVTYDIALARMIATAKKPTAQ